MIEIVVKVCGDHWLNPTEVEQILQKIPAGTNVMINMSTEGASMGALGVDRMINRYLQSENVWVRAWANSVETVPYKRVDRHLYSHFFWMAQRYWDAELLPDTHERRFGCFIGRSTWSRMRMLCDLRQDLPNDCLLSLMDTQYLPRDDSHNLDRRADWFSDDFDVKQALGDITSIDGYRVPDQYDPQYNTNLSILSHYHKFDIEIVAETYCYGTAFLATEKTIRPLLYRKPVLLYGPRHFLRNLREQGFQTWSAWWDESYDDLEGPERWQSMLAQIHILGQCDHFDIIYQDYQTVLDHNKIRAQEIGSRHQPQ